MTLPAPNLQNELANSMDKLQKLYPDTFDTKKYLYLPHGKYAFAAEHTFQWKGKKELQFHSGHEHSTTYARAGVIAGHKVTCLWKTWDISKAWSQFFQELYFYSHPKLLRWLQGIVVPHVIGVHHEPNGQKSILLEVPHHIHWHAANAHLPIDEKEGIIRAYESLHAHGIMHNSISFHNIFIDQDMNVALVNFETACCLNDKGIDEVPPCDQVALKREMRQVKYLIDYMDARAMERELLTAPEAGNSHGERQMEPLSILDMDSWDRLASFHEDTYTIPRNMRNRPLPNDGRKKPKLLKKGSQKAEAAISSREPTSPGLWTNQFASTSGGVTQHAANSGSQNEPSSPLLTVQPSFSAITSTPPPPLYAPADMCGFFSRIQLPPPRHLDSPPSTSHDEDTSDVTERDIVMLPPSSESVPEDSQALCSGQHNSLDHWPSASSPTPSLLLPSTSPPILPQPSRAPPSSLLFALGAPVLSSPDRPPSPKVFCDLTHEQLRLAIKQHNAAVDAKLPSQPAINTGKSKVVFHPDTNDNGTYATGSDPFRKRKKKRRPTPFFPEGSSSTEDESNSDEGDEGEEPEPHIEVDYEELVEEARLARVIGRRRISRPGILHSMVPAKSVEPNLERKFPGIAQQGTSTLPSPALSSISEEESPRDFSGTPPYTVVFVGADGGPDEVWQLPASAYMFVKSSAARQPEAKKLRVEQVPHLQGPLLSLPPRNQRAFNKRKIDFVEGVEYLKQTSKRTRQDDSAPSSCIIC